MRKRFFLVFCLVFLPITIYALENSSKEVKVGKVEGEEEVIDIKFEWDDMSFVYTKEENFVWNNETHKYEKGATKTYWNKNSANIDVKNNSSKSISVKPIYKSSLNIINGRFNTNELVVNKKSNSSIKFTISGDLNEKYSSYTKAGEITLRFE